MVGRGGRTCLVSDSRGTVEVVSGTVEVVNGLARTAVIALVVVFGLAIVGAVLIQQSDTRVHDTIGLVSVLAGVIIAVLRNTENDAR
jgi:hypothetical protein